MKKIVIPLFSLCTSLCMLFVKLTFVFLMLGLTYFPSFTFAQPAIPKFEPLKPVTAVQSYLMSSPQPVLPGRVNPLLPNDPYREQNNRILQQQGMDFPGQPTNRIQQEIADVREALREEEVRYQKWKFELFQNNFKQFLQLNPDNFSITKAIYLAESAFDPTLPSYQVFEAAIKQWAELVKQILKREGLDITNNTAINYAIQKLFQQTNVYYDAKTKKSFTVQPLRYDFNDPMGDKDWQKMFVNKVLQSGTGQCHSLPLFFLCVAEQLNSRAYLSLSPNHSFIQYFDEDGHRYNFECTNGNLVTQTFLMQSTYINTTALKNKTYLDTLSNKKLYAQCLVDLLLGYFQKIGYDGFSDKITKHILSVDSTNIAALMTQANYYTFIFRDKLQAAGNPPKNDFPKYPELFSAYQTMNAAQEKVEQTGFQEMSPDAYKKWLKSIEFEKQKEQNRIEKEKLKIKIEKLKKIKVIFKNNPKQ